MHNPIFLQRIRLEAEMRDGNVQINDYQIRSSVQIYNYQDYKWHVLSDIYTLKRNAIHEFDVRSKE